MRRSIVRASCCGRSALIRRSLALTASHAVDAPLRAEMGPTGAAGAAASQAKPFFAGASRRSGQPAPDDGPGAAAAARGRLDVDSAAQPGGDSRRAVVAELDGKRVHIGGYVVPLDFEATRVKEFLLVPFVGACIHVPPPPANQIVYVKVGEGLRREGTFDPVWVTGTMKTPAFTGLADAGYSSTPRRSSLGPSDRSCFDDMPGTAQQRSPCYGRWAADACRTSVIECGCD